MRRAISFVLVGLLLVNALVACDAPDGEETATTDMTADVTSTKTTAESTSPETTPDDSGTSEAASEGITEGTTAGNTESESSPNDGFAGCAITQNIYDYDEYLAYLSSVDIPSDFIHYDEISLIGEFARFYFLPSFGLEFGTYKYILKDSTGTILYLSINPWTEEYDDKWNNAKLFTSSFDPSNMHKISGDELASIFYNGIRYAYGQGGLICIEWEHDSVRYQISTREPWFNNYPCNVSDTFVGRLLNLNTATAEIQNFNAKVEK